MPWALRLNVSLQPARGLTADLMRVEQCSVSNQFRSRLFPHLSPHLSPLHATATFVGIATVWHQVPSVGVH